MAILLRSTAIIICDGSYSPRPAAGICCRSFCYACFLSATSLLLCLTHISRFAAHKTSTIKMPRSYTARQRNHPLQTQCHSDFPFSCKSLCLFIGGTDTASSPRRHSGCSDRCAGSLASPNFIFLFRKNFIVNY